MEKGKLNLDKKAIAKLSEQNLESVQGGGLSLATCVKCTYVTVKETPATPAPSENYDVVVSCNR